MNFCTETGAQASAPQEPNGRGWPWCRHAGSRPRGPRSAAELQGPKLGPCHLDGARGHASGLSQPRAGQLQSASPILEHRKWQCQGRSLLRNTRTASLGFCFGVTVSSAQESHGVLETEPWWAPCKANTLPSTSSLLHHISQQNNKIPLQRGKKRKSPQRTWGSGEEG